MQRRILDNNIGKMENMCLPKPSNTNSSISSILVACMDLGALEIGIFLLKTFRPHKMASSRLPVTSGAAAEKLVPWQQTFGSSTPHLSTS